MELWSCMAMNVTRCSPLASRRSRNLIRHDRCERSQPWKNHSGAAHAQNSERGTSILAAIDYKVSTDFFLCRLQRIPAMPVFLDIAFGRGFASPSDSLVVLALDFFTGKRLPQIVETYRGCFFAPTRFIEQTTQWLDVCCICFLDLLDKMQLGRQGGQHLILFRLRSWRW